MPTQSKKKNAFESQVLRITVVDPPPRISWALQLGREELQAATSATKAKISFDFEVEVVPDTSESGFRLRGPAVQGRPGERFVYLRIGAYAGQADAPAGWRAKVRLEGITSNLLRDAKAKPSRRLEVKFAGTGPRGGPACATVPLLGKGWEVA